MFIHERIRESGIPPSFDEMKEALDLKTKSGIHRLITALEERGFLRRMEKRARALEELKLPTIWRRPCGPPPPAARRCAVFPAGMGGGEARMAADSRGNGAPRRGYGDGEGTVNVPLVGRIAAGTPIEALQNKVAEVPVPGGMIGRGEHYALEVTGDSMINAGILDGDTVIIQEVDSANTGEIVVALVDDTEATLKRLRRRGDSIALEAANPAYETRLYWRRPGQGSGQAGWFDPALLNPGPLAARLAHAERGRPRRQGDAIGRHRAPPRQPSIRITGPLQLAGTALMRIAARVQSSPRASARRAAAIITLSKIAHPSPSQ